MYLVNIYINNHKTLNTCLTKSNSFISMQSFANNILQGDQKVEDIAKMYTFLYKYKNKKNKYK